MKIEITGSTKPGFLLKKAELENYVGKIAGICYTTKKEWEDINKEPEENSKKRYNTVIGSRHFSVSGHASYNMFINGIPKLLVMMLNNQLAYETSEKSARYTKMKLPEDEQFIYDKWINIFEKEISGRYPKLDSMKVTKLAQENARYLTSVFTPTIFEHTLNYRQVNHIYALLQNSINKPNKSNLEEMLTPHMKELCEELSKNIELDEKMQVNDKNKTLTLLNDYNVENNFSDTYSTNYQGSFAELAQAQRHRQIKYHMNIPENPTVFVPPIIEDNKELREEWLSDYEIVKDKIPQGMLVNINEMGDLDAFIEKAKERQCAYAQLEIDNQTRKTSILYKKALEEKNHPRYEDIADIAGKSRCQFKDYECKNPCGNPERIQGLGRI